MAKICKNYIEEFNCDFNHKLKTFLHVNNFCIMDFLEIWLSMQFTAQFPTWRLIASHESVITSEIIIKKYMIIIRIGFITLNILDRNNQTKHFMCLTHMKSTLLLGCREVRLTDIECVQRAVLLTFPLSNTLYLSRFNSILYVKGKSKWREVNGFCG